MRFETRPLPISHDVTAPDGSEVRILLALSRGSMAHFRLEPGAVARAVRHASVEELWFFVAGRGRMWRKDESGESVVEVYPGLSLDIPLGTAFQFRAEGAEPLRMLLLTMPRWPGPTEAVAADHPTDTWVSPPP